MSLGFGAGFFLGFNYTIINITSNHFSIFGKPWSQIWDTTPVVGHIGDCNGQLIRLGCLPKL